MPYCVLSDSLQSSSNHNEALPIIVTDRLLDTPFRSVDVPVSKLPVPVLTRINRYFLMGTPESVLVLSGYSHHGLVPTGNHRNWNDSKLPVLPVFR
jgi:hypothetical protein